MSGDMLGARRTLALAAGRPLSVARAEAPIGTAADGEPQLLMVTRDAFTGLARTTVLVETTAADGERTVVTHTDDGDPTATQRVLALADADARGRAWKDNPFCVECAQHIARPEQAGVLRVGATLRVAHTIPCFARGVAKHNPHFQKHAAMRAEGR